MGLGLPRMSRGTGRDSAIDRVIATHATAKRCGRTEEAASARTLLRTEVLRRDIERALTAAPPLTLEQRQRLSTLLLTGRDPGALASGQGDAASVPA